jgi:hypothetical protein
LNCGVGKDKEGLLFCTKIMEKIIWTESAKRKEPLQRVKEERNILKKNKKREG